MLNDEIIITQSFQPATNLSSQIFKLHEPYQAGIISPNDKPSPKQVMPEVLDEHNQTRSSFLVLVMQYWAQWLTCISDGTLITFLTLDQLCTYGEVWSIGVHDKEVCGIGISQHRSFSHGLPQSQKGLSMSLCPIPFLPHAQEWNKQGSFPS